MQALYTRDGEFFVPGEATGSPWSARGQHGGPPSGLIARAVEEWNTDPELVPVRLSLDLFRQIPMAPLAVRLKPVRRGRRLVVLRLSLFGGDREVCRASALLLRRSDTPSTELPVNEQPPPGPDGLASEPLLTAERRAQTPPGFHTRVEVRSVSSESGLPAAWIRMPMPLVEGEETTALQRAVALSDFGNALAARAGLRDDRSIGFINTDLGLYLSRPPEDEWVLLEVLRVSERQGIGVVEVAESDRRGRFALCCQARLAQSLYFLGPDDS